eukprot:TRINITY_DN4152_c0_g1_i1.p1 TRINITY_DN4152_c0_g1~~TRINITY_DN4152_c0_g1_i1.p1  ORF type:complete len:406 (+),score=132.85 TRINITY_DN4152_c0_g1_i1:122-1339(+)
MVLTSKQQKSLELAILDYLLKNGYENSANAFQAETGVQEDEIKKKGDLERKWTSVLRLQRQILDYESKITQLEAEIEEGPKKKDSKSGIPRQPAKYELKGHREPITAVCFHPIFSQIVSSSEDGSIKLWDYESGDFEKTLRGHTGAVQDVCFENSGHLLASCSADLNIKLWNTQSNYECIKTLKGHDHNVSCVKFTPTGDHLISSSRDKTIRIWEVESGYCIKILEGHEEWVRKVIVDDESNIIASCSKDQTIRLWNFTQGICVGVLREHSHDVECIAFSPPNFDPLTEDRKGKKKKKLPQGAYLASGSRDKTIKIWEVSTQQCILTLEGHDNWVREVIFHPDCKHLISVSDDKSIKIWDLRESRCIKTYFDSHNHFIQCADYNLNDPVFATGSVDKVVKIWNCK